MSCAWCAQRITCAGAFATASRSQRAALMSRMLAGSSSATSLGLCAHLAVDDVDKAHAALRRAAFRCVCQRLG